MEIGIDSRIATYSGGLGVLAADTIRSCADLGVPMVAVSLLTKKGYFRQKINDQGCQEELPDEWNPGRIAGPPARPRHGADRRQARRHPGVDVHRHGGSPAIACRLYSWMPTSRKTPGPTGN